MQVSCVVGVINAAGLNHEIVPFLVGGEEFYCGFGHLQDGRLVAFVALGHAVMVIAQVTRGEQAQNLAHARQWGD